MRVIKFRAWDERRERMVYDIHLTSADQGYYPVKGSWDDIVNLENTDTMQYIGLEDKNGEEIYEGDIMRHTSSYDEETYLQVKFGKHSGQQGFYLEGGTPFIEDFERFEVVGNIYENSNLLERSTNESKK